MTNPFREAATKDVYYPDEAPEVGTVELLSEEPVEAEDVPVEKARFGDWIQVRKGSGGDYEEEVWMSCPRDLQRALGEADAEPGHVFQVRSTDREDEDDAPWEYKVAHDPQQH